MKKFISFILLLTVFSTKAQVVITSLEEALAMAKSNFYDAKIQAQKLNIDSENALGASSKLLPQIKAYSNIENNIALPVQLIPAEIFGGEKGNFREVQFGTNYVMNAGLEANMPLINTNDWLEVKLAWMNKELSKTNQLNTHFELEKLVSQKFYNLVFSLEKLKIAQKSFELNDSLLWLANEKDEQKIIDPIDFNRIKAIAIQAKEILESTKTEAENHKNALAFYLGIKPDQNLELNLNLSAALEVENQVVLVPQENSPLFKLKSMQEKMSAIQLKNEQLKRLPTVNFYARYTSNAQRNSFDFFEPNKLWFNYGLIGLRLDWVIFSGYAKQANISKSKSNKFIAALELEKEQARLKMENSELLKNYYNCHNSYKELRKIEALNESNIQLAFLKYKSGVYSLDQYLNIYNEWLKSNQSLLKTSIDLQLYSAIIDIKNKYQQN